MELTALLGKLRMDHLEAQLDAVCEQAAQHQVDYKTFLNQALATEWQGRYQKGIEARLQQARFPWVKTLEQSEFDFQPSLDRRVVRELSGLSFVERAHNVIVLGPPGVGKTHLAIALGVKAVEAGYSVLFLSLETLMTRLTRAMHENRLDRLLHYSTTLNIKEESYRLKEKRRAGLLNRPSLVTEAVPETTADPQM
jgi:DNA replication protein DnaC